MRKVVNMLSVLLVLFAMTATARADAIASPALIAVALVQHYFWVILLIIALVIITAVLLRKFRKK